MNAVLEHDAGLLQAPKLDLRVNAVVVHRDISGIILRWPCGCVYQVAVDRWLAICARHQELMSDP